LLGVNPRPFFFKKKKKKKKKKTLLFGVWGAWRQCCGTCVHSSARVSLSPGGDPLTWRGPGLTHPCARAKVMGKTVKQQTQTKGYSEKVQAYNSMIALKRREKTKAGKKKRTTG